MLAHRPERDTDVVVRLHGVNAVVVADHFAGADLGRRFGPRRRGDADVSIGDHADNFALGVDHGYCTAIALPHQLGDNGEIGIWTDGLHIGRLQLPYCHGRSLPIAVRAEPKRMRNAPSVPRSADPDGPDLSYGALRQRLARPRRSDRSALRRPIQSVRFATLA